MYPLYQWVCFEFDEKKQCRIIDHGGWESRHRNIAEMFRDALQGIDASMIPAKTWKLWMYSGDFPKQNGYEPPLQQNEFIVHVARERENAWECYPCFGFHGWPEVGVPWMDDVMQELAKRGSQAYEVPKLFWIGAMTNSNREVLANMSKEHPERIEAHIMKWNKTGPGFMQSTKYVSIPDHGRYKYLIDIEGDGYSARLKWLLWSRRLLFVQDRPHWDAVTSILEPWVHYVPVKRDLSDLLEKLDWADEHPEEAQKIAETAFEFAQKHVTYQWAVEHMRRTILRVATLVR